jgi:hypothetical protein
MGGIAVSGHGHDGHDHDCGHGHDHDHGHDHGGHGHHDHHGHDHHGHDHGDELFYADGAEAAVVSADAELSVASARALLGKLSAWSTGNHFLVGHLKILLEDGAERYWISSTGGAPGERKSGGWGAPDDAAVRAGVTAILIGPSDDALRGALERFLREA